jgi:hypothetical protein
MQQKCEKEVNKTKRNFPTLRIELRPHLSLQISAPVCGARSLPVRGDVRPYVCGLMCSTTELHRMYLIDGRLEILLHYIVLNIVKVKNASVSGRR